MDGKISIAGGPDVTIVATNGTSSTVTTNELAIPFTAWDDDDRTLLPRQLDFSLMEQVFGDAYVLPLNNGGGNSAFNAAEVPFSAHLPDWHIDSLHQAHQQSFPSERPDHWVVYAIAAYQAFVKNDWDWIDQSYGLGVTRQSRASAVYVEVIRDRFDSPTNFPVITAQNAEAYVLCHEIGHHFVTGHPDPPTGFIMDTGPSTVQQLKFSPDDLAAIRDQVESP